LGRANAGRLGGLPPELRDREERARHELRKLDLGLRVAAGQPGEEAAARRGELWRRRQRAEDDLNDLERRLAATRPQYAALRFPKPCTLEEARRCLGEREVALLFALGGEASYVVVLHA